MTPNFRWVHRLMALVRGNRLHQDLDDELQFHIEARTRDNIAAGMTPEEARLAAVRLFGNRTLMTERMRDADVSRWVDAGLRNLRYAFRMLWRNPGFTAVVVLSMALGIGANTAVFSVLNAVLLKTLPVKNPEQLVTLEAHVQRPDGERAPLDWNLDFRNFRAHGGQHIDLFATSWTSAVTTLGDTAEQISVGMVTGNYYSVLGVTPHTGRLIEPGDNSATDPRLVAVLDYDFWRRRFGGDPGITSRQIVLNHVSFSIVGVLPRGFVGTSLEPPAKLTIPVQAEKRIAGDSESFRTIGGRLRPGVSRQQAESVLTSLLHPALHQGNDVIVLKDNSRGEYYDRDRFAKPLYVLMGGVILVLLISSANVASLLLARGAARQREMSIRLAIGASRGSIMAQLLTESVVIALGGAALGIVLAYGAATGLLAMLGPGADALDIRPDVRVLTFTTCAAVLTGLLFGLFPAFQAAKTELNPALKEVTGIVGRKPRLVARRALVVTQIALSLVLLSGAGLFARTLQHLRTFDSGYDRRGVLLASFEPHSRVAVERRHQVQKELLERVRALPGVESAGLASTTVLRQGTYSSPLGIEGQAARCKTSMTIASAGYLETMRMTLVAGRMFTAADNQAEAPHTIIVNQEIARKCFGSENPVGRRVIAGGQPDVEAEIIGVVTNAKYRDLREGALPMYYIPPRSVHPYGLELHVRAALDPHTLVEPIRRALREVDPATPLTLVRTLEEQSDLSVVQDRLLAAVSSTFAVGALALAAIGLYGVLAFMVARRTNEIGLRMALGAARLQIVRLILSDSTSLLLMGSVLGAIGAFVGQRLIQGLLFGVSPSDQWSLLTAAAVLSGVALVASLIPAGRAARIDPIAALRHE